MQPRYFGSWIVVLGALTAGAQLGVKAPGQGTVQPRPVTPLKSTVVVSPVVQRTLYRLINATIDRRFERRAIYQVPAGFRLKIEQVTGWMTVIYRANNAFLRIETRAGGMLARHQISIGPVDVANPPGPTGSANYHSITQLTAIYADPGTEVVVEIERGQSGSSIILENFTISGRLESLR